MFEHKSQKLIPFCLFILRMLRQLAAVIGIVLVSLIAGMAGYMITEDMRAVDAFYNASLILSGMGPANDLKTDAGKIFASIYSLYSGILVIAAMGFLLAPVFHRIIHSFHADKME